MSSLNLLRDLLVLLSIWRLSGVKSSGVRVGVVGLGLENVLQLFQRPKAQNFFGPFFCLKNSKTFRNQNKKRNDSLSLIKAQRNLANRLMMLRGKFKCRRCHGNIHYHINQPNWNDIKQLCFTVYCPFRNKSRSLLYLVDHKWPKACNISSNAIHIQAVS